MSQIFNKIGRGNISRQKDLIPSKNGVNLIVQKNVDNGYSGNFELGENRIFKAQSIIIGRQTGWVYYQPEKFMTTDGVLVLESDFQITDSQGLYLASAVNKQMGPFGYNNPVSVAKLKKLDIYLPFSSNGMIAFDYMEAYIKELEAERVKELEAYLVATGLNDYVLTDEEKVVLNDFRAHNTEQNRTEQNRTEQNRTEQNRTVTDLSYNLADLKNYVPFWGEFTISDIFKVKTPKKRFDANKVTIQEKGNPYVVRTSLNNGIRGYINEEPEYLNEANTISFGQDTATMFYQKEPYFTADKIKVILPAFEGFDETKALFLITSMSKSFSTFTWGSSSYNVNVINSQKIKILLDTDGQPDYETMGIYIKAIEKLVIKDVVEWKDRQIVTTKIVTSR
ncbi:restriction endonuclease subunit S [Convivina praedatoris]|uniref:restriction endonuclease subunit S n=1 Tax=Convivina praedatoris TaxID=2880963 RepID=UPI00200C0B3D|nr:restriction endonuclease subunit S [Convivina sp. LMG 32447]